MDKIKLKSGREVQLKQLSLDDEAAVVDTGKSSVDANGNLVHEMQNTAMLKYLRLALNGQGDDYIRSLSMAEKSEIYTLFINRLLEGEGKASSSK